MIGIAIGKIVKSGSTQHGAWALVEEPEVNTKSGKTFTPKVMCSGTDVPPDGTPVIAQGLVQAKSEEYDGKHYAKLSLGFCKFTVLDNPKQDAPAGSWDDDESIPF